MGILGLIGKAVWTAVLTEPHALGRAGGRRDIPRFDHERLPYARSNARNAQAAHGLPAGRGAPGQQERALFGERHAEPRRCLLRDADAIFRRQHLERDDLAPADERGRQRRHGARRRADQHEVRGDPALEKFAHPLRRIGVAWIPGPRSHQLAAVLKDLEQRAHGARVQLADLIDEEDAKVGASAGAKHDLRQAREALFDLAIMHVAVKPFEGVTRQDAETPVVIDQVRPVDFYEWRVAAEQVWRMFLGQSEREPCNGRLPDTRRPDEQHMRGLARKQCGNLVQRLLLADDLFSALRPRVFAAQALRSEPEEPIEL